MCIHTRRVSQQPHDHDVHTCLVVTFKYNTCIVHQTCPINHPFLYNTRTIGVGRRPTNPISTTSFKVTFLLGNLRFLVHDLYFNPPLFPFFSSLLCCKRKKSRQVAMSMMDGSYDMMLCVCRAVLRTVPPVLRRALDRTIHQ